MVEPHTSFAFHDMTLFLVCAAVVVPLVERLRVSPVLGYLLAGALVGPHALGKVAESYPILSWISVDSLTGLSSFAELGVVFLLFVVGLELPIQRLVTMRRLVFGLGSLQVAVSAVVLGLIASLFVETAAAASILGFSLALSSTAIVVEVLSQQQRLRSGPGRAGLSILLLQDLAVVPLMLLVTLLGQNSDSYLAITILNAFAQAVIAIGLIVAVGSALLRPLFRLVASSDNVELFVAAILLVALGSGMLTAAAGLSMALGAFVAGLLLAETEYRRAIETTIEPFKGLLLGVFFFSVGLSLDIGEIAAHPLTIMAAVAALVLAKSAIVFALMRLYGFTSSQAIESALLLGPAGEFAFIVLGLALKLKLIAPDVASFTLAVVSVSMALIPAFDLLGKKGAIKLSPNEGQTTDPELLVTPDEEQKSDAIVVGYGRVGELVADMLEGHGLTYVVTERAPNLVHQGRSRKRPVFYGDAKTPQLLVRCGLMDTRAVIITIHTWAETDELVRTIREVRPDVVIVARARDADHARRLYELGVTDAVPETIEASLQLSEAALVGLGVPTGPVIASIHEKRDEFRIALQGAMTDKTRQLHGLRAKKTPSRKA